MTRIGRFLGAVLVAGSSTQCLLFTESPNMQPKVRLEGPDTIGKTKPAAFKATVSDDRDLGSVRLQWFVRERTCPANLAEAQGEPQAAVGTSYVVERAKEGAYCVGAVARDDQGASGFSTRMLQVTNQRPTAKMVMLAPTVPMLVKNPPDDVTTVNVALYSDVRITGAMSEDDDPDSTWRYQWKVTAPAGAGEPGPCTTAGTIVADGPEICRRLKVSGDYMFELIISDGQAESAMPARMKVIVDPDALPCFERTEPPHDLARAYADDGKTAPPPLVQTRSERGYTFSVSEIRDDGHPYPPVEGKMVGDFYWQWRWIVGGTGVTQLTDRTQTSLTFPANSFLPGNEIEVRVQYRDGQKDEAYPCLKNNDSDRCESPTDKTCLHRVSWRLRFLL